MGSENRLIQMVVFDWAGTTVDYGSSAPSVVFDRVFTEAGLHLTREEINRPMGLRKESTHPPTAIQRERQHPMAAGVRPDLERAGCRQAVRTV